jgi:PTH1 family peptidyl-tRNA hydrolase
MEPIELIVGLGNPGEKYDATRHNAGFWFLDRLSAREGGQFRPNARLNGYLAEVTTGGRRVRLLKPTTFMNRSGQSVGAAASYYRVAPEQILVVHDEIDLPAGALRLKAGGGHGGHNGLRDIVSHLNSKAFLRLRLGVGHPGSREDVIGHVLKRASREEQSLIDTAIDRALDETVLLFGGDVDSAMNVLNRRDAP